MGAGCAAAPSRWDILLHGVWTVVPEGIRAATCKDDHGYLTRTGDYRAHPAGRAVIWVVGTTLFCWAPPGCGIVICMTDAPRIRATMARMYWLILAACPLIWWHGYRRGRRGGGVLSQ